MKVFISSVTYQLKDERAALPAFLRLLDHEPLRFEDFTAQDRSSRDACLAGVEVADVYILLLGSKYGQAIEDSGLSPTAEEFKRARQRGIPILVFSKSVDEADEPSQAEFKNQVGHYVNGRFWRSFTDPLSCNQAVGEALKGLRAELGPLPRYEPSAPVAVPWITEMQVPRASFSSAAIGMSANTMVPSSVSAPVLEAHFLSVDASLAPSGRQLEKVVRELARGARDAEFVTDADQLVIGSGGEFAWAVRPPERITIGVFPQSASEERFRGVVAHRAGLCAFSSLTTDMMGALVDRQSLQADLASLFGLKIHHLGTNPRAVAVIVPASVDGPHLIYRGEYFGAPIRNNADTVWMKERQIEAMYRARFDERRRSNEALDSLYAEAIVGRDTLNRAWLVAVARPRIPGALVRPTLEEARAIFRQAEQITLTYSNRNAIHPLENINSLNPRPGLRRWVAPNNATDTGALWREAWVSVHHDGSVTLAAAVGGHRRGSGSNFEGWEVESNAIEAAIADFTAIVRATATTLNRAEYDAAVGVEWTGENPLCVSTVDGMGFTYKGVSTPLATYTPVRAMIDAAAADAEFHRQVYDLAQDCVNQGGITNLHVVTVPESAEL